MKRHDIPITRESYIRLAWGRLLSDEEMTPEHEDQLPPQLRET